MSRLIVSNIETQNIKFDSDTTAFTIASDGTVSGTGNTYKHLNTTTITSSTSTITFDNTIITSAHQIYEIQFEGLIGPITHKIQLSPDNGSNYRTSGYNSNRRRWYTTNSGSSYSEDGGYFSDTIFTSTNGTTDGNYYKVTLLNMLDSSLKTSCIAYGGFGGASSYHTTGIYSGRYDTAEAHNNIRIIPSSDTFTSGKISIFGIRSS
tara:strand:+ start:753 stop:1373 length:621 start_codon:yes stop_codon:yes gene_type:complete